MKTQLFKKEILNVFKGKVRRKDLPLYDCRTDLIEAALINEGKFKLKLYQVTILVFQWIMTIHWICVLALGDDNLELSTLMGDFTRFLEGNRVYVLTPILIWSLMDGISRTLCFISKKLEWLGIFDALNGNKKHKYLNDTLLILFCKRSILVFIIVKVILILAFVIISAIQFVPLSRSDPRTKQFAFLLGWGIIRIIAAGFLLHSFLTLTCYGYLTFYYFQLRFSTISDEAENLARIEGHCIRIGVFQKLNERFNIICSHLYVANQFWKHILTCFYFGCTAFSCFIIYQISFSELSAMMYTSYTAILTFNFVCQMIMFVSAASVAAQVNNQSLLAVVRLIICFLLFQSRKIYRFLNKMSLNELPFEIKYKLMETIERVGGEPIGFTCSDLFIVTWTTFAEVRSINFRCQFP